MDYDLELSVLSPKFVQDYPSDKYPELLYKHGRPYTCLLIESHDDYFICVPFRSFINHPNAFMFTNTARSIVAKSGLDYSKIVLIKDINYFDSAMPAIVDQDEYNEMMRNISTIVQEVNDYVTTYINHVNGTMELHPKAFNRKYKYSALPYFHDIMGI